MEMMRSVRKANVIPFLVILATVLSCAKTPNEHYIEIQSKKQHVLTLGKGEPVVIFVPGAGSDLKDFDSVQRSIAKVTKTFSYDHPGLGKSELINSPRTLPNLVEELKELLNKEGIADSPIILVGHSMG